MPNYNENLAPRGWVLYDRDCRFCAALACRFHRLLTRGGFALLPLQSDEGRALVPGRADADLVVEMAVVTREREVFGGAEAILYLARQFRWSRLLRGLVFFPGGRRLADAGYRWIAANRHCYHGACERPRAGNPLVPLAGVIGLPVTAVAGTWHAEPWIAMWFIAFSVFFACKLLTLIRQPARRGLLGLPLGYLFLWPGMDPKPFLNEKCNRGEGFTGPARFTRYFAPAALMGGGVTLVWIVFPRVEPSAPYAAAWLGMTGIVLLLHFGLFHLVALLWQARGVPVRPLMRAPLLATSLAEFWGERWNRGFSDLARDFVYRPLWRRLGPARCTLLVFLISGLVHDLVISLPARGGWGLPSLYFLLQGFALLFERSSIGRRAGLGTGLLGRFFALAILGLPLFWLFHPPFIQRVVTPFLQSIQIL